MTHRNSFDYTAMSQFLTCHRKYDYRINKGLVGKTVATPLTFGSAIHTALDEWYKERDVDAAVGIFHRDFTEDLEVDTKRTGDMGEWILRNYHSQYQDQPWKLVHSEMKFDLPLPNGNKFQGRIDKVIDWDGTLWVVDHKSTSRMGQGFFKMAEPNMQFTGYVWAAKQLGYNVVGIILDAILVAKGLLTASSRGRLTPLARYDVYRSEDHLREWLSTVQNIQRDIQLCEELDLWYPNFDMCTYYGECPYRRVCKEDEDIRGRIIEADYDVDYWDPLKEGK